MDLEKETLKTNRTGLSGTRRILPKEIYEQEDEDEKEGKPKGWLSWFQGLYRKGDQGDETKPKPSIEAPETSRQSGSSELNAAMKNDSNSTSILSRILPTASKNDLTNNTQHAEVKVNNTATGTNSPPKQDGSKS